ncbi:MAG: LacI family DNA-binding transcriptional regulator [Pseudomonadota bacterium]
MDKKSQRARTVSINEPKRASIHDVARTASVSAATVSKVLRGASTVKSANVEKVKAAVEALGYQMDPLAAGLRQSRRRILGLIVPDLESEFFGRIAARVELLAERAGYSLSIASSHESEEREAQLVERMHVLKVSGTLLAPVRSERGAGVQRMKALGLTGALVDRVISDDVYDTIGVDNAGASAQVARLLAEKGHRHVLLIGLNEVSRNVRARAGAFTKEAGSLAPDMRVDSLMIDERTDSSRGRLSDYLDRQQPTAVFSLFQKGTLLALAEFRRRGIRCPDDVSLVGFDDAEWMRVTYPSVTAVVQPLDRLADIAFERLLARVEGQTGASISRLEPCALTARESLIAVQAAGPRRARRIS